jgi:thiamine-phosphate pyrophosphorylase
MSEEFFETEILPDETSFGDEVPEELRPRTKIYLISPLDVTGDFPERLERVLAAGVKNKHGVAAFQFRVKGMDEHAAAPLAVPLQKICTAYQVAFIVNDSDQPGQASECRWRASGAGRRRPARGARTPWPRCADRRLLQ